MKRDGFTDHTKAYVELKILFKNGKHLNTAEEICENGKRKTG